MNIKKKAKLWRLYTYIKINVISMKVSTLLDQFKLQQLQEIRKDLTTGDGIVRNFVKTSKKIEIHNPCALKKRPVDIK